MSLLARLAGAAPVPIFPAIGRDGLARAERLFLSGDLQRAQSPRQAAALVVVGALRAEDGPDLARLHDQLPHPRATLAWGDAAPIAPGGRAPETVAAGDDPTPALVALHRDLVAGRRASEPDLLPDEPPNPWRGRGDWGQGGEGMMGGTPYGRPMPMTDEDLRDGLMLDAYTAPLGPFLPSLPPGLVLETTLQGDVIQSAAVRRPPHRQAEPAGPAAARLRIARLVRLMGLDAVAERLVREALAGRSGDALARRLARHGVLAAIPPGLGTLGGRDVRDRLAAWCAEAAGAPPAPGPEVVDARLVDLLPGLEWHEATLVAASFDPAALIRLCPRAPRDDDALDEEETAA
ncbi:hypothetical protein [Salinarimonas sp.]|uniref:hypothetical protein n=1 Tax=Salinarimonas sp. TaxID=2766526 RepID=UPI0032D946C5